eukprot:15469548-Alexandrium_andersonii.AAC.1
MTEGSPSAETGAAPEGAPLWYEIGSGYTARGAAAQHDISSDRVIGFDGLAGDPRECMYTDPQSDVLTCDT